MTGYAGVVVADDLTGAMDTGHEFAKQGHGTTVSLAGPVREETEVLVVSTGSRYLPAGEAGPAVASAVESYPADVLYKKVDSTLRGNLAAEVEAAIAARNADVAVVAPAFPANGRATACGYHFVDGALVSDTPAGRDPDATVRSSHLPTVLSAADSAVVHLAAHKIARGASAVQNELVGAADERDQPIVVCDAFHEAHLDALASGARRTDLDVLYVGSAGLARFVRLRTGGPSGPFASGGRADGRGVLGIAGSTNPLTMEQVSAVEEDSLVRLDVGAAVGDPRATGERTAQMALEILSDRPTAVIASALEPDDVNEALRAGDDLDVSERVVRTRIAAALAEAAGVVAAKRGLGGLFLTGGTVAREVLRGMEVGELALTGNEVAAGVPVGIVSGEPYDGLPVVTKAGGFGDETTIATCLDRLRGGP